MEAAGYLLDTVNDLLELFVGVFTEETFIEAKHQRPLGRLINVIVLVAAVEVTAAFCVTF